MDIKDIQKMQKEFDLEYFPKFWELNTVEDFMNSLKHVAIGLAGEVGEFSNLVKKLDRRIMNLGGEVNEEYLKKLRNEVTDIFIYVLIAANLLEMNLDDAFLKKIKYNRERFQEFRDNG